MNQMPRDLLSLLQCKKPFTQAQRDQLLSWCYQASQLVSYVSTVINKEGSSS